MGRLLDCPQVSAHCGRLASLNEGDKAVIDFGDMSKNANGGHQSGAKESNDHDFQVRAPVRVIH
jgi:hypothetical protein